MRGYMNTSLLGGTGEGMARSNLHMPIENEQLLPPILHDPLTEMIDQPADSDFFAFFVFHWEQELVLALI